MRTSLLAAAAALVLALAACGDDDGGDDTGDDVAPTPDAALPDAASAVGGLGVPVTITMQEGFSGTTLFASICQNLAIGGGISYSLVPTNDCLGGAAYATFFVDPEFTDYEGVAGTVLTPNFDGPAVDFVSTTAGTLDETGQEDAIHMIPADTAVTVVTADHTFTFQFTGGDITVSAWSDN